MNARAAWRLGLVALAVSCSFDRGDRWIERETARIETCTVGERRCALTNLEECVAASVEPEWQSIEACADRGLSCAPVLTRCAVCNPGHTRCDGFDVERCSDDGAAYEAVRTCDAEAGFACRAGSCTHLCGQAGEQRSNVGCEYWAVDLDNANIDESLNAAAQQFAVVLSNPQPDMVARVIIARDDTAPTEPGSPMDIVSTEIPPFSLQVVKLGPREVDGSPPGEYDTGTHTALTRAAYRVKSSVPIVAYQFNPLENVNVFSNDASLLKPVEALVGRPGSMEDAYVVLGWPQTIASTDDPNTNFNPRNPRDLRAFLTIVGTHDGTTVRVEPKTRILGGGPVPETPSGGMLEMQLDAFDVLNLETDDFNADFTGSLIAADQPIVVFSGSEASDAPFFDTLADRACCADHLEEQLDPIRTAGKQFVATISPNRASAIRRAGAPLEDVEAPEYFRIAAVTDAGAVIRTTLSGQNEELVLRRRGDFVDVTATTDFVIESDEPVAVSSVTPSQDAAGIPSRYPGGDPSFLILPPVEQYRTSYVFLTPDRYSFDFIRVIAPRDTDVTLDGESVETLSACVARPIDGLGLAYVVYQCQLGFPVLDPAASSTTPLAPGVQNDGVHEVIASKKVNVLVDGFDRNVSYAYAAGTELVELVAR